MISRRSSRNLLLVIRWAMLVSGATPFVGLLIAPSTFPRVLESQISLALVLVSYSTIGLFWAAMEKEYIENHKDERLASSVLRVCMVLCVLCIIPVFVSIAGSTTQSFYAAIHKADEKAAEPGLITTMRLWPAMWAIICAYSLKPIWDHAVAAVRGKWVGPVFDLSLPEKGNKSLKGFKRSIPRAETTGTSVKSEDMIQAG